MGTRALVIVTSACAGRMAWSRRPVRDGVRPLGCARWRLCTRADHPGCPSRCGRAWSPTAWISSCAGLPVGRGCHPGRARGAVRPGSAVRASGAVRRGSRVQARWAVGAEAARSGLSGRYAVAVRSGGGRRPRQRGPGLRGRTPGTTRPWPPSRASGGGPPAVLGGRRCPLRTRADHPRRPDARGRARQAEPVDQLVCRADSARPAGPQARRHDATRGPPPARPTSRRA